MKIRAKQQKKYNYYIKKNIKNLKKLIKMDIDNDEEDQAILILQYFKNCKKRLKRFKERIKQNGKS